MQDSRFSHVLKDPRFLRPKKNQSKVTVDSRFQTMFTDKRFVGRSSCKVDKFGRPVSAKHHEDASFEAVKSLRRFYKMEDENNVSQQNFAVDFARGEGLSSSSSSEDEQYYDKEDTQADPFDCNPAALDQDSITVCNPTSRLAIVNLDWDNIQAQDIFQLVHSFKPPLGQIKSVKIYYSAFGKQRIAEESVHGPPSSIFKPHQDKKTTQVNDDDDDDDEQENYEQISSDSESDALVDDQDSEEIAESELEEPSSSESLSQSEDNIDEFFTGAEDNDLLEENSFKDIDENLLHSCEKKASRNVDDCGSRHQGEDFDPSDKFVTATTSEDFDEEALRKYQLERLRYCYAIIETDAVETAEAIYVACDGKEFEATCNIIDIRYVPDDQTFTDDDLIPNGGVSTSFLEKYSSLSFTTLSLMHSKVSLTWDADDSRRAKLTRAKFSQDALDEMDFRAYIASTEDEDSESEENGKEHKEKSMKDILAVYKQLAKDPSSSSNPYNTKSVKDIFGEDEEVKDVDMEMTFYPDESEDERPQETVFQAQLRKEKEKRKRKRDERKGLHADHLASLKQDKSLSLLVDNPQAADADGLRHFNMNEIVRQEKAALKRSKSKRAQQPPGDSFEIQLDDPRFTEVYTSYDYSIDPSHPSFKNTSSMRKILDAKRAKLPGDQ